jgi:hypothetical protein
MGNVGCQMIFLFFYLFLGCVLGSPPPGRFDRLSDRVAALATALEWGSRNWASSLGKPPQLPLPHLTVLQSVHRVVPGCAEVSARSSIPVLSAIISAS